ncbi:MAG: alpha/beta fold hydrolase [Pseudomonadota bacterium]
MRGEATSIRTADGRRLVGRWYRPRGAAAETLVLHGATGLRQSFYRPFAEWLARERDIACLTYDYRDFGESLERDIRFSDATFLDWGLKDQAAALAHGVASARRGRVRVLGHSLGGFFLNRHAASEQVDHAAAVGSGEGNFLTLPPYLMPASIAFWFGHGPALTAMFGYLPGRLSGFGSDLPAGVYWEWRRWCVEPYYSRMATPPPISFTAAPPFPIRLIGIEDDPLITPYGVRRLERRYDSHPIEHRLLRAEAFGLPRLGHIGPFVASNAAVWPAIVDYEARARRAA